MKNQKGITLVALVVTIVVLLILAGITIMFVLNGGIIGKAQDAKTETHDDNVRSTVTMAMMTVQTELYDPTDHSAFKEARAKTDPTEKATAMKEAAQKIFDDELKGTNITNAVVFEVADETGIKLADGSKVTYNEKEYSVVMDTVSETKVDFKVGE